MLARALASLGSLICCLVIAGCSDSKPQPICCDWGISNSDLKHGDGVSKTDGNRPAGCNCNPGEVCDTATSKCVVPTPQPGEIVSELVLLRQMSPMDTTILKGLGKGEADFYDQEPLPPDTRQSWTNADGDKCAYEMGTTFPSYYDGKSWPSGPPRGAGNLTFTVTGAAGPIVLEAMDMKTSGWAYFHGDVPPHLTEGSTSYPDFFDPAYLPPGAPFQVQTAGGPHVGVHTLTGGELPIAFTITAPPAEAPDAQAASGGDLKVQWAPPQPSAYMEIFITSLSGMEVSLLSCKGRDDGALIVPAAAMKMFYAGESLGLQLRRTTDRYSKITTTGGKILHVHLMGRHARLGRFTWK